MSVFNTCFVINLYFQNMKADTMHPFIHVTLFRVLPAILFIRRPVSTRRPPVKPTPPKVVKTKDTNMKYANFSPLLENYKFTFDEKSEQFQSLNRSTAATGYAVSSQLTCNDKIKKRSNLYNFEKIKSSFETDNEGSLNKSYSRILYKGVQSNQCSKSNYVTLDNIKETKTLVNASRSIQYISHIMKAKADIKEAIIVIFFINLFIQMKLLYCNI